uniref:(northern house mosquito) hypothetical protein n=1 Tax=Culex pipiens TaxID=7175 RepID=A0A8D8J0F0_CULPI
MCGRQQNRHRRSVAISAVPYARHAANHCRHAKSAARSPDCLPQRDIRPAGSRSGPVGLYLPIAVRLGHVQREAIDGERGMPQSRNGDDSQAERQLPKHSSDGERRRAPKTTKVFDRRTTRSKHSSFQMARCNQSPGASGPRKGRGHTAVERFAVRIVRGHLHGPVCVRPDDLRLPHSVPPRWPELYRLHMVGAVRWRRQKAPP